MDLSGFGELEIKNLFNDLPKQKIHKCPQCGCLHDGVGNIVHDGGETESKTAENVKRGT